jgi:hypothetical protein
MTYDSVIAIRKIIILYLAYAHRLDSVSLSCGLALLKSPNVLRPEPSHHFRAASCRITIMRSTTSSTVDPAGKWVF